MENKTMSKLTFAVCALFTAILFAFALCFALLFAKLDSLQTDVRMARRDVVTLTTALESLRSDIHAADENLDTVEYFVFEDGSIQIVRDNGETVVYCLENAPCSLGE
jgi:outer membrane murein-binding lipoprotein Lpp